MGWAGNMKNAFWIALLSYAGISCSGQPQYLAVKQDLNKDNIEDVVHISFDEQGAAETVVVDISNGTLSRVTEGYLGKGAVSSGYGFEEVKFKDFNEDGQLDIVLVYKLEGNVVSNKNDNYKTCVIESTPGGTYIKGEMGEWTHGGLFSDYEFSD